MRGRSRSKSPRRSGSRSYSPGRSADASKQEQQQQQPSAASSGVPPPKTGTGVFHTVPPSELGAVPFHHRKLHTRKSLNDRVTPMLPAKIVPKAAAAPVVVTVVSSAAAGGGGGGAGGTGGDSAPGTEDLPPGMDVPAPTVKVVSTAATTPLTEQEKESKYATDPLYMAQYSQYYHYYVAQGMVSE